LLKTTKKRLGLVPKPFPDCLPFGKLVHRGSLRLVWKSSSSEIQDGRQRVKSAASGQIFNLQITTAPLHIVYFYICVHCGSTEVVQGLKSVYREIQVGGSVPKF